MWSWWPIRTDCDAGGECLRTSLRLESLEAREVPAVLIQIDYSFDTGFFANPAARAVMDQVASELGNSISGNLPAITPGGGNTWTASFFNPATGGMIAVPNLTIANGAIKVFVGGRSMNGPEAGFAGTSGFGAAGAPDWVNSVQSRMWGGSIAFDTNRNWYFGQSASGLTTAQLDFYSVSLHEMGHVLGIGTSTQWANLSSGGYFHGANAVAVYGGAVPLAPDGMHWANGLTINGQPVSLDPDLNYGQRVGWSALDAAALRDLGWNGTPAVATATITQPIAVAAGGTVSLVTTNNGSVAPTGASFVPFPGYVGELNVAAGDFNGDGVTDYAVAPGLGGPAIVEIINGRDGSLLVGPTNLLPGYTGGLSLAAGDIDGNGKDDLVVATASSAPPLVATFRVVNGALERQSAFVAFNAGWFAGGIRVAVGDINHDGYADVVVTTASMVGAVAVYSGADLRFGVANYLFAPFVPLTGSPLGLTAAVGDLDGDGYADIALTFASGGPGIVAIWSGAALTRNPRTPANQIGPMAVFLALPPTDLSGARLTMRDLNNDGRAELVIASGSHTNPLLVVIDPAHGQSSGVLAGTSALTAGISVG